MCVLAAAKTNHHGVNSMCSGGNDEPGAAQSFRWCPLEGGMISIWVFLIAMLFYSASLYFCYFGGQNSPSGGTTCLLLSGAGAALFVVEALLDIRGALTLCGSGPTEEANHSRYRPSMMTRARSSSETWGPAMASDCLPAHAAAPPAWHGPACMAWLGALRVNWALWEAVFFLVPALMQLWSGLLGLDWVGPLPGLPFTATGRWSGLLLWGSVWLYLFDALISLTGPWRVPPCVPAPGV